jgi:hypothetical protein
MKHGEAHDEDDEGLHDGLSQIPDRFIVAEEMLDEAVRAEYVSYAQRLAPCPPDEAGQEAEARLFDPTTSLESKREALTRLAQGGTVEAYRAIERYAKRPDPELAQWSKIALWECRMAVEGDLRDEPVGMIFTGLGGAGPRLRHLVAVGFSGPALEDGQRRRLESAWRMICARYDSILEEVRYPSDHAVITLLVSMEAAVGTVVDEAIAASNGHDPILRREYFVTNVTVPTEAEIRRVLKEIPRDEAPR